MGLNALLAGSAVATRMYLQINAFFGSQCPFGGQCGCNSLFIKLLALIFRLNALLAGSAVATPLGEALEAGS